MVGGVDYRYGIGQLEITVTQWVGFLEMADPTGSDPHHPYSSTESSTAWPKYGQINFSPVPAPASITRWRPGHGLTSPTASPTSCVRRAWITRSTTGVQPQTDCLNLDPFGPDPTAYAKAYQGGLSTVGQAKTPRPGARSIRPTGLIATRAGCVAIVVEKIVL